MFNTIFGQGWNAVSNGAAATGLNLNVTNGTDTLTSGAFNLAAGGIGWYCITVPTPGAAALLGLGGLMAARRRRA
jgi:MYXO-CTERM domain-containing protein